MSNTLSCIGRHRSKARKVPSSISKPSLALPRKCHTHGVVIPPTFLGVSSPRPPSTVSSTSSETVCCLALPHLSPPPSPPSTPSPPRDLRHDPKARGFSRSPGSRTRWVVHPLSEVVPNPQILTCCRCALVLVDSRSSFRSTRHHSYYRWQGGYCPSWCVVLEHIVGHLLTSRRNGTYPGMCEYRLCCD